MSNGCLRAAKLPLLHYCLPQFFLFHQARVMSTWQHRHEAIIYNKQSKRVWHVSPPPDFVYWWWRSVTQQKMVQRHVPAMTKRHKLLMYILTVAVLQQIWKPKFFKIIGNTIFSLFLRCPKPGWGYPSTGLSNQTAICRSDKNWNLTSIEQCSSLSIPVTYKEKFIQVVFLS